MWFSFVGDGLHKVPGRFPQGSYKSESEALGALRNWRNRVPETGSNNPDIHLAACHVRLRAYPTREQARRADISDSESKGQGRTVRGERDLA